jgi:hypothetical protein
VYLALPGVRTMTSTRAPFLSGLAGLAGMMAAACDLPELREAYVDAAAVGGDIDASDPPPGDVDAGDADAAVADGPPDDPDIPPGATIGSCDPETWRALASAEHPVNPASYAIDGLLPSRWTSGAPQAPGLTFDIDLGGFVMVSSVTVDHGYLTDGVGDFPRGVEILASYDGTSFDRHLGAGTFLQSTGSVSVEFPAHAARHLRLQLTSGGGGSWWTIHELRLGCATPKGGGVDAGVGTPDGGASDDLPGTGVNPNREAWTATASHSSAADPASSAIDGSSGSRWASGKAQYGDEWLRIDLGRAVTIREVWLTASDPDYPAAFQIETSADDTTFTPAARGLGSPLTKIAIPPTEARYLRVKQIGSGYDHWWGVNDVTVIE